MGRGSGPIQSSNDGRIIWDKARGILETVSSDKAVEPVSNGGSVGDIQRAIDRVSDDGGGRILIRPGTYQETDHITLRSSVSLVGQKESTTIIDFNSLSKSVKFEDSSVYDTGTITGIAGGVTVTGSGTSWLANLTTNHQIFISNRWYKIAAITGNTTLILQEGHIGNTTFPTTYRASVILSDMEICELTIKNSADDGIIMRGARNILLSDLTIFDNNVGIDWDWVTENSIDKVIVVSSTSDGVQMTNVGFGDITSLVSTSNGGNGYTLNTLETMPFNFCAANANTGDGVNATSIVKCLLAMEARANGGQGVEFVSGCNYNFINNSLVANNTSDGIKLTATCDRNIIGPVILDTNGAFGINIAALTCDKNLIHGNQYLGNVSGTLSDGGTSTTSADNVV